MAKKPKSLNEVIKSMTPKDWDLIGDEITKKLAEQEQELSMFMNSSRFQEVLTQIKQAVVPNKSLGDNPYQEPLLGNVSNEEFIKMFSVAFNEILSGAKVEPVAGPFYSEQVHYQGLIFLEIHGQGTAFIVQGPEYKASHEG